MVSSGVAYRRPRQKALSLLCETWPVATRDVRFGELAIASGQAATLGSWRFASSQASTQSVESGDAGSRFEEEGRYLIPGDRCPPRVWEVEESTWWRQLGWWRRKVPCSVHVLRPRGMREQRSLAAAVLGGHPSY